MNIYTTITNKIIEQLKSGTVPWKKCWKTGLPKSLKTRAEYRGINLILLSNKDFSSQYYVTFNEARNLGGAVRKGEKGSTVIYWHWRSAAEIEALKEKSDREPQKCFPKLYTVFNVEQCEGLLVPSDDSSCSIHSKIQKAESIVHNFESKPLISHGTNTDPCYKIKSDRVELPPLSQFISANQYYATLFHELIHSTAHQKRLNRPIVDYRSLEIKTYSFEELIAELGSAFLCAQSGIEDKELIENEAAYLSCWIKYLESDTTSILKAASAAQKAVDFIINLKADELTQKAA